MTGRLPGSPKRGRHGSTPLHLNLYIEDTGHKVSYLYKEVWFRVEGFGGV